MTHYLKGQARNGSDALNTITRKPAAGEYLTPAADSDITIYNPLEVAEELVVDALNRGALLCQGETITDKEKAALLDYTGRYGLLGFMTAIPLNGGFMVYPHVFFGRNGFFDADYMETKDYLQIFQPFGSKQGQLKTGFTMSPALVMGKTLEYSIVFSRNYAERTDWLFGVFSEFYTYFAACAAYHATDNPALRSHYADIGVVAFNLLFRGSGISFGFFMDNNLTDEHPEYLRRQISDFRVAFGLVDEPVNIGDEGFKPPDVRFSLWYLDSQIRLFFSIGGGEDAELLVCDPPEDIILK